jgi:hypothetical protein
MRLVRIEPTMTDAYVGAIRVKQRFVRLFAQHEGERWTRQR